MGGLRAIKAAVAVKHNPLSIPAHYGIGIIIVLLEIYIIRMGPARAQDPVVTIQTVIGQDKIIQQLRIGDLKQGLGMIEVSICDINGRISLYIYALLRS
jgi:hypothetical protein